MRIVVPVCADDLPLACLNLKLAAKLDSSCPFPCLISAPSGFDISEFEVQCSKWFATVDLFRYDDWKGERAWPRPQNWAWQETARFIPSLTPPLPWFWWEADATPLKKGWFKTLLDGYAKAGKPFAGHIVGGAGNGHMNGVAIYPHDVRPYGKSAFITRAVAFDRMLSSEIGTNAIAPLNNLIGHYLKPPGRDSYTLQSEKEIKELLASELVLFHGASDGSLAKYMLDPPRFSWKSVLTKKPKVEDVVAAPTPHLSLATPPKEPTSPPCIIMLGGLGDVLIALPIAYHYSQKFGTPIPFITGQKYQNVISGCSYIKPVVPGGNYWKHYRESIVWAQERFEHVLPLHVGEPEIRASVKTTRFCHEQYLYAAVPDRYGEFPLVFDRRSPAREANLITRVRGSEKRPLILYNVLGYSSPFNQKDELMSALQQRWGAQAQFVNVSSLQLPFCQDLLGLIEQASIVLSIDTSTVHLMAASKTPYIALVNDTKGTDWWQSVPRGNCVVELKYSRAMRLISRIHEAIEKALSKPKIEAVESASNHCVTLACNGMEEVWNTAWKTWEPWCRKTSTSFYNAKAFKNGPHPSWQKLEVMLAALESHPFAWWVDADVTVARQDAILPSSDADLLFASDWNGLCAGMFRARSTQWTKDFLKAALILGDVRDPDQFGKGCGIKWEQNAIKLLLRDFPSASKHVELLPKDFMWDRPLEPKQPSPSFYHFGGMSNEQRITAMRKVHSL